LWDRQQHVVVVVVVVAVADVVVVANFPKIVFQVSTIFLMP